jgi:PmbA protein
MVERERSIKNDQGLDLSFRDRFYDLTLLYKKLGSTDIVNGSITILSRRKAFDDFLAQTRETLPAFLRDEKLPSGSQLPIVWLELDCAPLGIFSRELLSRRFGTGNSLFSGKLGQTLFSPHCTLVQDNSSMLTPGIPFFDAEGVVNSGFSLPLIENGVLLSPYSDKRTAHEFNLKVTGSAASDHDGSPSPTGFFPRLQSTHSNLRDILKGQKGIFVAMAGGGDYDSVGRFGSPVQSAFLHDGERLVARLPEFQVSGDMSNLFGKNLRGICHSRSTPGSLGGYVVMDMDVTRV